MRNYEIILMIYSNKNIYIDDIIKYYSNIVNKNGKLYRLENWGLRKLAYNIKNNNEAYYILMNIRVNINVVNFLNNDLKLNKNILRFIIIKKKCIETNNSIIFSKINSN